MSLISKLAWIALPALAGCGVLSQVPNQGTGTNPGGKAAGAYPPSWVQHLRFPEERDFLGDAGLNQYKKYADYIKPNVGVPESKLGMTMLQFRDIEKEIAKQVLSRSPKEVVDQIKKDKYGVTTTATGATPYPEGMSSRQFNDWLKQQPSSVMDAAVKEFANQKTVPATINNEIANYVIAITDGVLKENGLDPKSNPHIRSMAFVRGAYYFTAEGVQYEDLERSLGPGSGKASGINTKGSFILDRPRGVCDDQTITLICIINTKANDLGVKASYHVNETATSPGNKPTLYGFNHAAVTVKYSDGGYLEGYDVTKKTVLDTRDIDARSLWATGYNGAVMIRPSTSGNISNDILINGGDPISTFDRGTFQSLGSSVNNSIRDALRR